jgi:hypothetical protein
MFMFCRSLFVLLSFFFWPLCCVSFRNLRILITPFVSSNSSFSLLVITFLCIYLKHVPACKHVVISIVDLVRKYTVLMVNVIVHTDQYLDRYNQTYMYVFIKSNTNLFCLFYINVREYRRGNQKWIIQRN